MKPRMYQNKTAESAERDPVQVLYKAYKDKRPENMLKPSLRGRRLKWKGKGVLGKRVLTARETRGGREEGGRETPARKPLFFSLLTSTRRMLKS